MIIACIPAYNEESTIGDVVKMTLEHVDVVLVCDDGSSDNTLEVAGDSGAVVFRSEVNLGKGATLSSLIKRAFEYEFDVLVVLDGDGQHYPEQVRTVVAPILEGVSDAVVGSRYMEKSVTDAPAYRRFGLSIINKLNAAAGGKIRDAQSGFRAYNRVAVEVLVNSRASGYDIEMDQLFLLQKAGLKIVEVPISVRYTGLHSTSKKNPVRHGMELVVYLFNLIIRDKPILFVGGPGVVFMLSGLVTVVHFLNVYNSTGYFSVPWAIVSLGLILFGLLLVMNSFIFYILKITLGRTESF